MYDLTSPGFSADPYPTYARLLAESPVYHCEQSGVRYLVRYADVLELLRNPAATAVPPDRLIAGLTEAERRPLQPAIAVLRSMALFREPPEQTWLRRAMGRPLVPDQLEAMQARVEELVEELLDAVQERAQMDVIEELANPLTSIVIAELLGADPADRQLFRRWSGDVVQLLGVPTDAALGRRVQRSVREAVEYFRPLLRRAGESAPNGWHGSILRELLAAQREHPTLDDDDLLAGCALLVVAGHETSANLIANGLLCLLRHPDQLARLRADPALLPGAVEECLRYESPIQRTGRILQEPVVVGGGGPCLPAGAAVSLVLGAAHRDPEAFTDPDRFDITRRERPHLAFGSGRHHCLGRGLGSLEACVALGALLRRFEDLRLLAPPQWEYNLLLRHQRTMPVAFRAGSAAPAAGRRQAAG